MDALTPARGERELVRHIREMVATSCAPTGPVPFGDDMATVREGPGPLLWTVDMVMDGVDFDAAAAGWRAAGRKAMAVNLSDCAAMAAEPVSALCAVALANNLSMTDALEILAGATACGAEFGCSVVGGDTNSWDHPTVISVTVAGRCPPDIQPVRRDGARPGDRLVVTGPLGGSILGRHLTFRPRIAEGLRLAREMRVHAMMDVSDGLALDLSRMCEASGCGAVLDAGLLDAAIHADARLLAVRDDRSAREHALEDGEDFELIAAVPSEVREEQMHALGLLPLGRFVSEPGIALVTTEGRQPVIARGWEHFT